MPLEQLNFDGLYSAYFAISIMRAGRKIQSWRSFWAFYQFIGKRIQKKYVQKAFKNYDAKKAGGRYILALLVKWRYPLILSFYVFCTTQFEKRWEAKRWKKFNQMT